jgi:PKD repeat protein/V8-like Glu-specific endopeptidase
MLFFTGRVCAAETPPAGNKEQDKPKTAVCRAEARIIDGTNAPTTQISSVAEISDAADTTLFSGTLIAPQYVLTAGHCVTNNLGVQNIGHTQGRVILGGVTYNTEQIYIHSTYKGNLEEEGEFDAAILKLATPVAGITPSPLFRQAPTVGTELILVGFGLQGTGATGENGTLPAEGTVNYGATTLDLLTETYLKWTFEKRTPLEANTARGDSGGPAFINVGGTLYVAGITSGGNNADASWGDLSYDTRVDKIVAWIDSIAGTSPGPVKPTITGPTALYAAINEPFSHTFSAFGYPEPTYSTEGLPVWLTLSGAVLSGTPSVLGGGTFKLTATNAEGSDAQTISMTVLDSVLPSIISGPTALPSIVSTGSYVSFTAAAQDPTGQTPTYAWDFGDGTTGSGASVSHAYYGSGAYVVKLTVTGAAGPAAVAVAATSVLVYEQMDVMRVNIKVAHGQKNRARDAIDVNFAVELSGDFKTGGSEYAVSVAGVQGSLKYTDKGKAEKNDEVKIQVRKGRNGENPFSGKVTTKIAAKIAKRDLRTLLAEQGLGNVTTDKTGTEVNVSVIFMARSGTGREYLFGGRVPVWYKSKEDVSGRAKY